MEVKVNDGAEANILPLHTFRSMFPHQLDEDGYLKKDALRGSRMTLQCYDDSKLVNHGTITLDWKHYSKDSFQDHQFFVVETPTWKEIIIGHPASVRLGLIQVLCKNHAKTVSSIEADQTNNLFRVHNIDGKTQRPKWSSSEPKSDRRRRSSESASGQIESRRTNESPKRQMEHPYGTNNRTRSNFSSFQDPNPWWEEVKTTKQAHFKTLDPEHDETSQGTQLPSITCWQMSKHRSFRNQWEPSGSDHKESHQMPHYKHRGSTQFTWSQVVFTLIVPGTCRPCILTLSIK